MESPNPRFALYGATSECARTNTYLLPLSDVRKRAVFLLSAIKQAKMLRRSKNPHKKITGEKK